MNTTRKSLCALSVAALVGCQSTATSNEDQQVGTSPATTGMEVTVTGADATVSDSTITLEYPVNDDINFRVPVWVINPAMGGVTGAVGTASPNPLGTREQLDQARLNGRLELASMLEVRVQRVGRSELEHDQRVELGADVSSARRDTIGVDRDILDMVLAGTRQRALWWDTDTGEVYVWMVTDGAILDRVAHTVSRDVSIFTSTAKITREFLPERAQPLAPTVVVQMPDAPVVPTVPDEPEPVAPLTPIEELEENLKPIETIPVGQEDDGGN